VTAVSRGHERDGRGDVDDTAAVVAQVAERRLVGEKRSLEVDVEDEIPLLLAHSRGRGDLLPRRVLHIQCGDERAVPAEHPHRGLAEARRAAGHDDPLSLDSTPGLLEARGNDTYPIL
jgi:hypothetical protein